MLEPIPFAGMVEIGNDKSLVEQAPYHPSYENVGFKPTKLKELTDEEIEELAEYHGIDSLYETGRIDFAKAILRKAQEK